MATRPILPYPHPGLSEICEPVTVFDGQLQDLVSDLIDTMRAAPGVGITAAHIGVKQRVFVLELTPGTVLTYVNPEIIGPPRRPCDMWRAASRCRASRTKWSGHPRSK